MRVAAGSRQPSVPWAKPAAPTGSTQRMFNERAAAAYLRVQGTSL